MIIAVSGTQNVGKSTFIKDFLNAHKEFATPELDYRGLILKHHLKINRDGDLRSQNIILDFIISDLKKQTGNVILDRSCIDAYVYGLWHYLHRPVESGFTAEAIRDQYDKMREAVILYDKVLFIPLCKSKDIKIIDDRFRDTDSEYRKEIDRLFSFVIDSLGDEFKKGKIIEISGDRELRLKQADEKLGFKFNDICKKKW